MAEYVMSQQLTELQEKHGKLLQQRNELRETINNGQYLKSKLRETRKDAKYLSKQKNKLRTLADIGRCVNTNEELGQSHQNLASETPPPEEKCFLISPLSPSHPLSPQPPPPEAEIICAEFSPGQPTAGSPRAENEVLEARTDANALRLENENLVRMKRKLEEQVQRLVQEIASLEAKYEEMRGIAQRLEAENQYLSQNAGLQNSGGRTFISEERREMELMNAQLKCYEEDFKKERSERQKTRAEKERLKHELNEAKATIKTLQHQLKQALTGEGGYGDDQFNPRGPITNEPYQPYVPLTSHLSNGLGRTYSGGYIGPGASNFQDVVRREHAHYPRKVFLSPDMTAVVDRDVIDATKTKPPKSI